MKHVPNAITLGNLCAGCLGIVALYHPESWTSGLQYAAYWIFLSLVLDFLDGLAARILKAQSALGRELDSLADMVSFGVLPGLMMFRILEQSSSQPFLPYFALILPVCSAWRLARFNLETEGKGDFRGLPTPASALAVAGLAFTSSAWAFLWDLQPYSFLGITLVLGALMLSSLPLLSLKFQGLRWSTNWARYLVIFGAIGGLVNFQLAGIVLIFLFYLGLSLLYFSLGK